MKIRKPTLNFIIDSVAFGFLILLAASGILMEYILPPRSGHFMTIWGLNRHDWGSIHFWIAILLLTTMSLHLIFHWDWIVCRLKGRNCDDRTTRIRVLIGIASLIALLALALAPIFTPVEKTTAPGFRRGRFRTNPSGQSGQNIKQNTRRGVWKIESGLWKELQT